VLFETEERREESGVVLCVLLSLSPKTIVVGLRNDHRPLTPNLIRVPLELRKRAMSQVTTHFTSLSDLVDEKNIRKTRFELIIGHNFISYDFFDDSTQQPLSGEKLELFKTTRSIQKPQNQRTRPVALRTKQPTDRPTDRPPLTSSPADHKE